MHLYRRFKTDTPSIRTVREPYAQAAIGRSSVTSAVAQEGKVTMDSTTQTIKDSITQPLEELAEQGREKPGAWQIKFARACTLL